ncbi:MAG: oligosaccharide flippase family protein, partial [Candidatus Omnitrophica bacterium]|nr:oligosaccharide flippase family protein [Candidatus Omnitrophota bacterium]
MQDILNFKRKVILGIGILSLVELLSFPLRAVISLVLARLLEPLVFGIFGIMEMFIYFGRNISTLGLEAYLVQKKEDPKLVEYRTIFTLRFILGSIFLFLIFIFSSHLLSLFKLTDKANMMIRILSLVLLIEPFSAISKVLIQRGLQYEKLGIINLVNLLASRIVIVILVYLKFGVWSFIWGYIFIFILEAILFLKICPWKIGVALEPSTVKKAFKFGSLYQLSETIAVSQYYIIPVLGGIIFGPQAVGYLSWGYNILSRLSGTFNFIIGRITFPAVSRIQDNFLEAVNFFVKVVRYLMFITA